MTPEIFIIPLIMKQMNNIDLATGIYILDIIIILLIILIMFTIDISRVQTIFTKKIVCYIKTNKNISIILTCDKKKCSIKYRAIMYYISQLNDSTIYCLKEKSDFTFDYDEAIEKNSEYSIDQNTKFNLSIDIYGIFRIENKEKVKSQEVTEFKELHILTIFTFNKTLLELQNWIDDKVIQYNKYLIDKTLKKQLLITVQQKDEEIVISNTTWESNSQFSNSYLPNKEFIMGKIDFFLNNKSWYSENGIPYNLGILLYGEPGCGKTRFIKQLLNYTKRHAVDIKLNDTIDLNEINKIVNNDMLKPDLCIPQDKRIIIFEDIDAMGELVKDRNLTKDIPKTSIIDDFTTLNKLMNSSTGSDTKIKKINKSNNNLSFLLNIIDGLNECSGRIIIMTTNRIDYLDKALIRPGRIDLRIKFSKLNLFDIYSMYLLYWKDTSIPIESMRSELNLIYTSAEVINLLRSDVNIEEIKKKLFI